MTGKSLKSQMDETVAAVKRQPADASVRMQLFRLFVVSGQWDRARAQLDAASNLDPSLAMTTVLYGHAIACEEFRTAVLAGERTPVVLGEPEPWVGWLIEALRMPPDEAAALRDQAFDAAPESSGTCDGTRFDWLADADSRFGPVCEVFLDGQYYWAPFARIAAIELPAPEDMLDLVWAQAQITLTGGGTKPALIPVRYAGSETNERDDIRLARATDWLGDEQLGYRGSGQREWAASSGQWAMLDVRSIEFDTPGAGSG